MTFTYPIIWPEQNIYIYIYMGWHKSLGACISNSIMSSPSVRPSSNRLKSGLYGRLHTARQYSIVCGQRPLPHPGRQLHGLLMAAFESSFETRRQRERSVSLLGALLLLVSLCAFNLLKYWLGWRLGPYGPVPTAVLVLSSHLFSAPVTHFTDSVLPIA